MHPIAHISGVLALTALACGPSCRRDTKAPDDSCGAHQAVVDGLEGLATYHANKQSPRSLGIALRLLYDVESAKERLRICEAAETESPGSNPPQKRKPKGKGVAEKETEPSLDDGKEDLDKVQSLPAREPMGSEAAALDPDAARPPRDPVYVKFLDGDKNQYSQVMNDANGWARCKETGLKFYFYDPTGKPLDTGAPAAPTFNVRVTFTGVGYWSAIGVKVPADVPADGATMQLAGLDKSDVNPVRRRRTVLHEFGHSLGLLHEHLRESVVECIDPVKAKEYYARPPNNWDDKKTEANVLRRLEGVVDLSHEYDYRSIMNYVIPREILKDPNCQVPEVVTELSEDDCKMIAHYYPKGPNRVPATAQVGVPFKTTAVKTIDRNGRQYYRWTIKPTFDTRNVESIDYEMEPYFRNTTADRATGFSITREGWGTFPIAIDVRYNDGQDVKEHVYSLELPAEAPRKGSP